VTAELERQAGNDEGREEDGQKALSGASEGDGLALGGVEGLRSAGVSAIADLQGVTSSFDWYLDRVVHIDRSGTLTVNHDVVRATPDLGADCFMRQLQRCGHCWSPLVWKVFLWVRGDAGDNVDSAVSSRIRASAARSAALIISRHAR
jgi:hypothetical protein